MPQALDDFTEMCDIMLKCQTREVSETLCRHLVVEWEGGYSVKSATEYNKQESIKGPVSKI